MANAQTWTYESRQAKRQRDLQQFQQVAASGAQQLAGIQQQDPYASLGKYADVVRRADATLAAPKTVTSSPDLYGGATDIAHQMAQKIASLPHPEKKSGGILGKLKDAGSALVGAGEGALHAGLTVTNTALGAPAKYVGEPAFATLTGETSATRKPILDQNGNPTGQFYRDKPGLADMLSSLGNVLTHPVQEYQRGAPAFEERLANPHVQRDIIGSATLQTAANPLALAFGPSGAAVNVGAAAGTTLLNQHAEEIPGYRDLSPDVQQLIQLAAPIVAGHFGPKLIGKGARGVEALDQRMNEVVPGTGGEPITAGMAVKLPGTTTSVLDDTKAPIPQIEPGASSAGVSSGTDAAPPPPSEPPPTAAGSPSAPEPAPPMVTTGPFTLPDLTPQPLGKGDRLMNAIRTTILGDRANLENEYATPAMRYRKDVQPTIASQAKLLSTTVRPLVDSAFVRDATGRVKSLPGAPTIQDIAARLDTFEPFLTQAQRDVMEQLRTQVAPYRQLLDQVGIDNIGSRPDVTGNGFYLPRGNADLEGADMPVKVGSGRGGVGGRKSFEKSATFDAMSEGIDAGYQYAPLEDALGSYVRQAGNRVVDQHVANYFKNLTDEDGNPIGTGPHARLLEQNAGLASRVEGLRKSLTSAKGTLDRLTERQQAAIDEFVNSPGPDLEALKGALDTRVGASAVGKQGPNFGKNPGELRATMRDLRTQVNALMPEWKKALDKARQTPREQGSIGFAQLSGTTFPDAIANAANKYLQGERPPSGAGSAVLHTVNAFNNLMRGLRASADASFAGIQGLIGAGRDPVAYGKAMGVAFKAMADPDALGKYLLERDKTAAAEGRLTSTQKAAAGLHLGGAESEFAITADGLLPRIGPKIANAPVIKQSNRMFGYFGDVLRDQLFDTAYDNAKSHGFNVSDPTVLRGVADAANLATGWSRNTFGGSVGQLAEFAPRFLQSQLEYLTKAATDGSITGIEARQGLLRLMGTGTLLTVGANEASGRPIDYKQLLDPQSSNFMRIRVGNQDVSLFGPWDSLAKSIAKLEPINNQALISGDVGNLLQAPDVMGVARSKASPFVGEAWDLITGKTFTGQDARSPGEIARSLLPFSLQDIGRQSPLNTAIGATGLKANPLTPTEQLDQVAQAQFGDNFYNLQPADQKAIKDEHPDLWQRAVEKGTAQRQRAFELQQQATQEQSADDQLLLSGQLSPAEWKAGRDDRSTALRARVDEVYGGIANQAKGDPTLAAYYQAIDASKVNGRIDWDAVDAYKATLTPEQQAIIDRNSGLNQTPVEKLRSQLSTAYNDLPIYAGYTADEGRKINQLLMAVSNSTKRNAKGSATQIQRLQALRQNADGIDPRIVQGARRAILGLIKDSPQRKAWLRKNPASALFRAQAPLTAEQVAAVQKALA